LVSVFLFECIQKHSVTSPRQRAVTPVTDAPASALGVGQHTSHLQAEDAVTGEC